MSYIGGSGTNYDVLHSNDEQSISSVVKKVSLKHVSVEQRDSYTLFTGVERLEAESCKFENCSSYVEGYGITFYPFVFSHLKELKEAYFNDCEFGGMGLSLNGCTSFIRIGKHLLVKDSFLSIDFFIIISISKIYFIVL